MIAEQALDSWEETIFCPSCDSRQAAKVEMTPYSPFPAYVHTCEICEYIIMESEWERVETE